MAAGVTQTRAPAEEMRAAAKTLRCEHSFPCQPPHGSLAYPGDCSMCSAPWSNNDEDEEVPEALRQPLAEWLEEFADWHDASHFHGLSGKFHECGADDCTCFDRALAVARAIHGKES